MAEMTPAMFQMLLSLADTPRHGLGIVEEIETRTNGHMRIGPAQLYTTLRRLTDGGMIELSEPPRSETHADPRRKYYRISAEGRIALAREAEFWAAVVNTAQAKKVLPETRRP